MKTDSSQHAQLYTELSEMNKLRQQAKNNDPAALGAVAEQFEQLFLNMLMKSMRDANAGFSEGNYFNSPQVKFYQDMADSQLTKEMAESNGIGLAEVLVRQLGGTVDPRMSDEGDDKKLKPLSESERLLNRTVDTAANMAASAILGQAQANASAIAKAQADNQVNPLTNTASAVEAVGSVTNDVTVNNAITRATDVPAAVVNEAVLPDRFSSPEEFVQSLLPMAQTVAKDLGVDPKVLLAQAALETGWGRHLVQKPEGGGSHNLFNIKADSRWNGDRAQVGTVEFRDGVAQKERAAFRVYESYEHSFRDYAEFLTNNPRYQGALEQAADPYRYLTGLQEAGYATDPEYANKISRIFDGDVLAGLRSNVSTGSETKES